MTVHLLANIYTHMLAYITFYFVNFRNSVVISCNMNEADFISVA